ncbi:hypothetical protein [Kangiella shandongensis]|uniref:hypothetical protein n=1 Tax=Kangiella shandongensis TaxID=2763258 RepID=UPI001CBCE630|nr:hypothetical protein [Kangiella shandongensis]
MFKPRLIQTDKDWLDADGIKLYTISAANLPVNRSDYLGQLKVLKLKKDFDWARTAAFAIFHDGASAKYLVLVAWGNDNELFTTVSVRKSEHWFEDPEAYSFCLWDMEVMWAERNIYIETMYSGVESLDAYRATRPDQWLP